jgi:hypothetical protein
MKRKPSLSKKPAVQAPGIFAESCKDRHTAADGGILTPAVHALKDAFFTFKQPLYIHFHNIDQQSVFFIT